MDKKRKNRLHLIIAIATVYIIIGFAWWSILLLRKNEETWKLQIDNLRLSMIAVNNYTDDKIMEEAPEYAVLMHKHNSQQKMILGEGSFLFIGLLVGVWFIGRTFNKEMQLTQQRQNFLLSVTHELKSPLASISLVLQTIKRRNIDEEKKQHLTTNALKEAERLNELVNNILLSTKLDTPYEVNPELFNLVELTEDLVEKYQIKFPKVHFEIISDSLPLLYADRQGILSVMSNLIENAAKYAIVNTAVPTTGNNTFYKSTDKQKYEDAFVKIKLEHDDEKFCIEVSDNGIGISVPERKKIFEKFYRVGNEMTRTTKGTGLGLYIVSQIVKAHKGTIRISDNEHQGSVFKITLPDMNKIINPVSNFKIKEGAIAKVN